MQLPISRNKFYIINSSKINSCQSRTIQIVKWLSSFNKYSSVHNHQYQSMITCLIFKCKLVILYFILTILQIQSFHIFLTMTNLVKEPTRHTMRILLWPLKLNFSTNEREPQIKLQRVRQFNQFELKFKKVGGPKFKS